MRIFDFLSQNLGTILVLILLTAIVAAVVIKMIKDKRSGKSGCSCGCEVCAMAQSCGKRQKSND